MTGENEKTTKLQQPEKQPEKQPIEPRATPAPRHHASTEVGFLATRAGQMSKDIASKKVADPGLPDAAKPISLANAKFVPLPAGGIAALVDHLFPDDVGDPEAMANHVYDLLTLNRDIIRDDTSSSAGTHVRIP